LDRLRQNGLGNFAIALIRGVARLGTASWVAEMVVHLAIQRKFFKRLLECQRRWIDGFGH
jgi:hypothetical protein